MGAVGAEIEPLEDPDQLREAVLHLLAPAELALVVEVGLVDHALEQVVVGVGELADDLVDPVADLLGALERDHVREAAPVSSMIDTMSSVVDISKDPGHHRPMRSASLHHFGPSSHPNAHTPRPPWSPHRPGDSMHDAFLKPVFADRRMAEILIRRHAPEWATEIDFSTLREESTGLVSKKTLQRRHPDMIWSADTVKGGRVLFLLEFQRTVERLMALRTTTYTALTLEGIAAGADFGPGDPLPEFVYLVLYHGDGLWTAPARTADLFQRSDPGRYRLVRWRGVRETTDRQGRSHGVGPRLGPQPLAGGYGRAVVGPVACCRDARRSGPGWIHGPDGGYHVRVEGLPRETDEGRSEDHGRGGGQVPAGHGRVGPERRAPRD